MKSSKSTVGGVRSFGSGFVDAVGMNADRCLREVGGMRRLAGKLHCMFSSVLWAANLEFWASLDPLI
jgi:hypothetical protein